MPAPHPIRLLIADDHEMVRESLKLFLLTFKDIDVVAEASNGEGALKLCAQLQPDVILMDMVMPEMDGPTTIRRLREICPSTKVLVLTSFPPDSLIQEALQAGATGYLFKEGSPEELVAAIRAAFAGSPP
jgi:NarL family two-component system response regulator LiaR